MPSIINSRTDLYCIFGSPVRHSLSPVMLNAAFQETGINAVYLAFEPASIQAGISSMKSLGIKGASVTIPFKIDALGFVDNMDPLAARIGSVNTIVNSDGILTGYNTDGYGAIQALANKNISIENATSLIIGNGGSARAIAFTLLQNRSAVALAGRNIGKVEALACDLRKQQSSVRSLLISDLDEQFMNSIDIIINTTPVGMAPHLDAIPLHEDLLFEKHTVFDIVYSPVMTKLLTAAEKKGCAIVNGIEMLIYQGARQFELWTGKQPPIPAMFSAIVNHLQK